MSLENESLQYLVDSWRNDISPEQAAEFEQWLEKHYPMSAFEFVENVMMAFKDDPLRQDLECVKHSLAKWQGAQTPGANLRYRNHNIVAPQANGDIGLLQFDSDSCALCRLQEARCNSLTDFCDGTSDGRIKPCPFVREFGHRCDDESHDIVNIYGAARHEPLRMVAALITVKQLVEKEIKDSQCLSKS